MPNPHSIASVALSTEEIYELLEASNGGKTPSLALRSGRAKLKRAVRPVASNDTNQKKSA